MPAAFTTLQITNNILTADLVDGDNYQLTEGGYSPAFPGVRPDAIIGGSSPYELVTENLRVNVRGATAAACLANYYKLGRLLDQSNRWRRGDPMVVRPVLFKIQPQGSNETNPLVAVIEGRAGTGARLAPAPTFLDELMIYEISNVNVGFVRRGLLLEQNTTSDTVSNNVTNNLNPMSTGFASLADTHSPIDLVVTRSTDSHSTWNGNRGFIVLTQSDTDIIIFESESATIAAAASHSWATAAETSARGGTLGTLTSAATPTPVHETRFTFADPTFRPDARSAVIIASLKNPSDVLTWNIRIENYEGTYKGTTTPTPVVKIAPGMAAPDFIVLGEISSPYQITGFDLVISAKAPSSATNPDLEFDMIALIAIDTAEARIIYTDQAFSLKGGHLRIRGGDADPDLFYREARLFELDAPAGSDALISRPYRGNVYLTCQSNVTVTLLLCGGGYWSTVDGNGAKIDLGLTAYRRLGYVTPI